MYDRPRISETLHKKLCRVIGGPGLCGPSAKRISRPATSPAARRRPGSPLQATSQIENLSVQCTRVAHEAEECMSEVGREVRRRREVLGWSQAKLAVEAGMAVSAVSQIENGHRRPSAGSLEKLSRAYGL